MTTDVAFSIEAVALEPLRFDLRRRVANAKTSWASREGIVVRLTAGGVFGYGEASPLPGFSSESLADVQRDLHGARDGLLLGAISVEGDAEDAVRRALGGVGALASSARFALETAVLDLRARLREEPLWHQLVAGGGATIEPVPISALLVGDDPTEIAAAAEEAMARGIGTGKLKVGRPGARESELAAATAVRRVAGASFRLRLDANGAWRNDEAREALAAFAGVGPELVEEPVGGDDWLAMERSPVPVAMDESGVGADGARLFATLVERGLCDALVLKLSMSGGFLAAATMAKRARAAHLPVIVTHMFEGPIATAAAAAFALAFGSRSHAAGLDVRAYTQLPDDHPVGTSVIAPPSAAGLGLR